MVTNSAKLFVYWLTSYGPFIDSLIKNQISRYFAILTEAFADRHVLLLYLSVDWFGLLEYPGNVEMEMTFLIRSFGMFLDYLGDSYYYNIQWDRDSELFRISDLTAKHPLNIRYT